MSAFTTAAAALVLSSLSHAAPPEWRSLQPSSSMRLAEWELPGEEGHPAAEVVLFYFGEGSGGSVEDNLARWFSQFEQPDGAATEDSARVERIDVGELLVTRADMSGTYVAPLRPGSRERRDAADFRMIAAVVEGPGGPWFIRLVGPSATVSRWSASFDVFLRSLSTGG